MSLHHAAQHLAAQGRGPDETLVHMSGKELAGLQAIAKAHGGSLTTNPSTGLPEAGFLSNILPAVIGAGLTAATGGAAAPWMIGAGVGGLTALQSGNLGKGIMAGLGAYGGAGLYGGAEAAGMFGGEQAATQAAATVGAPAAATDMTAYAPTPTQFGAFGEAPVPGEFGQFGEAGVSDAAQRAASASYGTAQLPIQTPATPMPMGDTIKYGLGAVAPAINTQRPPIPGMEKYDGPLSKYYMSKDYKAYNPQPPNPYYEPQRYTYGMAGGGPVEQMSDANAVGMNTGYPQADITGHAYATPWQTPMSQNVVQGTADTGVNRMDGTMLAEGGPAYAGGGQLGGYSDGGHMLKGPGDGMSDSIPAQIGSKQPARLADGEFVVPADVVSHLGNGSSDAGAKQLYKMMDRIRAARTGKKKQAPQVNPAKAMPA
jgi:hypothetical protein